MFNRLKYGKIIGEGPLTESKRKEYKKLFSNYDHAKITVTCFRDGMGIASLMIKHPSKTRIVDGRNAWDELESKILMTTLTNMNEIPFLYEHRDKFSHSDFVMITSPLRDLMTGPYKIIGRVFAKH